MAADSRYIVFGHFWDAPQKKELNLPSKKGLRDLLFPFRITIPFIITRGRFTVRRFDRLTVFSATGLPLSELPFSGA